jgi:outer membrane protein assembly factor BamB
MKSILTTWALLGAALFSLNAAEPKPAGRLVLGADYETRRMALVDEQGQVRWEHPVADIHDLHRLPNGNVLFQMSWTRIVEMSPDQKFVWSYDSANRNGNAGQRVEVHAFQRLENGRTMIAESGPGRIIEVDRDGNIQKEIKLKRDHPSPHSDTRLVRKLGNGHYLAAQERDGVVREYDESGAVVWEFAVPMFGQEPRPGHGVEAFGNSVYCALRLPSGNTLIGTGNGHSVLEVTPEKKIVWSLHQNDLPGIQLAWVTMLEVLPNGHIVIGNCHAGPTNPQLIEVDRDKNVIWTFKNFEVFGNAMPVSQLIGVEGTVIR